MREKIYIYLRLDSIVGTHDIKELLNIDSRFKVTDNGLEVVRFILIQNGKCRFLRKRPLIKYEIVSANYMTVCFNHIDTYNFFLLLFSDKMKLDIEYDGKKYWRIE